MKPYFVLGLVALLTLSATPLFAQNLPVSDPKTSQEANQSVSKEIPIERIEIKASQLYQGMTRAEVEKVMGKPTDIKTFPNADFQLSILSYFREPIITKISLIDGHLTGLTTQAKTITDKSNIPPFARAIEVGMSRKELLKRLGTPFRSEPNQISGTKFERLTFRTKDNKQQATIILRDDHVEMVNKKFEYSPQILSVVLPKEPSIPQSASPTERIRIGMNPDQVVSIFGKPDQMQPSQLDEQQVTDWVYSSLKTNASTRFTFVNGVLTRFAFIPQSSPPSAKN